jgi:hypothetical protein
MEAAKAALGGDTATASVDAKASAAQAGVDKASADATAEGTPLTPEQQTGLLEGLKGLL